MNNTLAVDLADLKEDEVINQVKRLLSDNESADEIFKELQRGMGIVGERFQKGEYYLSELIMSADILKSAIRDLEDKLGSSSDEKLGTMVLGTVLGDIHDIGKDIVALIFKSNGFKVIDLGVDVPIERFVEAVRKHKPEIVGLSCLLTTSFDNMKATIEALEEAGLRDKIKILIGGGPVDQSTCDYVGADTLSRDVQAGLEIAKLMIGVK